jgi:hypothetical protein
VIYKEIYFYVGLFLSPDLYIKFLAGVTENRKVLFVDGVLYFHFTMLEVATKHPINTYHLATQVDWLIGATIPKLQQLGESERDEGVLFHFFLSSLYCISLSLNPNPILLPSPSHP